MRLQNSPRRALSALSAAMVMGGVSSALAQAQTVPVAAPRPFSMSFHNADAADVLRAFALQSGLSLAVSPSVKGKIISIRLHNVSADEALRLITQAAGVTYRHTRNAYLVGSAEEMKKIHSTDTFASYPLKHLSVSAAKAILEGMLPYISTQGAEGSSMLTITGTLDDVQAAQNLLALVDVSTAPVTAIITPEHVTAAFLGDILRKSEAGVTVEVRDNTLLVCGSQEAVSRAKAMVPAADVANGNLQRVEVYRIRYSSAASLASMLTTALPGLLVTPSAEAYAPPAAKFQPLTSGSNGSSVFSTSGGNSATGGGATGGATSATGGTGAAGAQNAVSSTKSRQIILTGSDLQVDQALRLLKSVDVAPAQVSIEARIVDITSSDNMDLGIQWGSAQTSTASGSTAATTTFTQGAAQNTVSEQNVPDFIKFGRFARSPFDFATQLQFLQTKSHSKILANPRISVVDNEDANIFIGDVLRYQILAISSTTTGNGYTVEEVPVGIALLVRPRVNDNGEITIKVHPAVSTLTSLVSGLPQTASREADTTLRVHDGETIAIGGLIRDQDIQTVQEVPLLAKLPFFGELFRNRSNQKQKSDVVIFLTIHLLPDSDAPAPVASVPAVPAGPALSEAK